MLDYSILFLVPALTASPNSIMDTRISSKSTTTTRISTTGGKKPAARDATVAIEKHLSLAEYEIHQDAYRGITTGDPYSPWWQCRRTTKNEEGDGISRVSQVCPSCACPSLISWTNQVDALQRKKGKRKRSETEDAPRLGRRRDDPTFQCPCDYNPVSTILWLLSSSSLSVADMYSKRPA